MNTEMITCRSCQTIFQWEHEHNENDSFYSLCKPLQCDTCLAIAQAELDAACRAEKERWVEERVDGHIEGIMERIPPLFQQTNIDNSRFNRAGWDKVKNWRPTSEKPWLGLIGETGTCKSRIGYLLALDIAREMAESRFSKQAIHDYRPGPGVTIVSSYEITNASLAQFSSKQHAARSLSDERPPAQQARDFLDSLRTVDFLFIDDIGKGRLSPAVAAELFAIVDHRYQHQLAIIWTANNAPEQIAAGLSDDLAAPFAGRLHDSSRIVRFKL